jgi:hypothetical protein
MAWQPNGHLNGSGKDPKDDDNVASLADARSRAAAKAKREKRAALGPNIWRDRVIGAVIVLMALGMIASWAAPLFRAAGVSK